MGSQNSRGRLLKHNHTPLPIPLSAFVPSISLPLLGAVIDDSPRDDADGNKVNKCLEFAHLLFVGLVEVFWVSGEDTQVITVDRLCTTDANELFSARHSGFVTWRAFSQSSLRPIVQLCVFELLQS